MVATWREHWKRVYPYLTDEWQTLSQIVERSGISSPQVSFALRGAEENQVVDFRHIPDPLRKDHLISCYRQRISGEAPAGPAPLDVNPSGVGLMRRRAAAVGMPESGELKTCSQCGKEFLALSHKANRCPGCRRPQQSRKRYVPKGEPGLLGKPLNRRERVMADLIFEGTGNKEIAARLRLSEGTVKEYVSIMSRKLGVNNRTQIAVWVARERAKAGTLL